MSQHSNKSKNIKHSSYGRRPILFSLIFLLCLGISALAVHDENLLELDGNIADSASPGGTEVPTDWGDLFSSGSPGGTPLTLPTNGVTSIFVHDESDPDSTLFSGSKDTDDVSDWDCTSGTPSPDKNNLMHVYAAAFQPTSGAKAGHTLVYMALERYANDGTADVGFWLLQDQNISCTAPGTFTGTHQTGDLLVVASFTNGGAVSTIKVYEWSSGSLNTTPIATGADCASAAASDNICGKVNTASITTPWANQDKTSAANTLAVSEFFEIGIDVTNLLQTGKCTTTFMAETRTSSALNANLSDYVLGSVNICGTITIIKDTVLDDPQDFSYTTTGGLSPSSFSLDDDSDNTLSNTQTYTNIAPGTYTVTESLPVSGFDLTNLVCVERDSETTVNIAMGTATIDLDPGESVTCTYTNTKKGSINIIKNTVPDDPQDFSFSSNITGCTSFSLDDDSNATLSNTKVCNDLAVGSYTITESAVSGFILTNLTCSDPDNGSSVNLTTATATIDLDAGETITCTFTNTKQGTIQIIKDTVPDDPQDFSFSSNITGCTSFSLDDDSDGTLSNSQDCTTVPIGSYTITEAATTGFSLTNLSCSDPDNQSSTNVNTRTANIDLDPGETVICTFTNTKQGRLIVQKVTNPAGETQSFNFSATGGLSPTSFSLQHGQSQTFNNLAPGSGYSLSETVPSGWDLTSSSCDDGSAVSNISISAGETVTCTFTNTKRAIVIINKTALGGNNTFGYTGTGSGISTSFTISTSGGNGSQTFTNVQPGTKTVTESGPSTGWDFTSLICSDPDNGTTTNSQTAIIDLDAGETVMCTFTNIKRGTLIIQKVTNPTGDTQSFNFSALGSLSPTSFSLQDGQSQMFSNVIPGSGYSVSETVPSGWDLTGATCDDGSAVSNINISAGEIVTCTFTNTKRGMIIVEKQTTPNGDSQSFTFTGDASGSISDGQQITVNNLVPGTYTSTETMPNGWMLSSIVCNDANSSSNTATRTATFQLEAGETVKCTFNNTKQGTIILEKQTLPDGDSQSFAFTGTASGSIADNGQITVSNLNPGTYTSTETVPSGWDLTSISCDDSNSSGNLATKTATFQVAAGETVKCTFINTKRGTIVVEKQTIPDGSSQSFVFTGTASGSISDGQQITVSNLQPGTYTSTETATLGWDVTAISCDDTNSSVDVGLRTATFELDPGETVKCTFTNTKRGTIIVEKQTLPDGDSQSFAFTGTVSGSISDGQQITVNNVQPGTYTSAETVPSGWDLTSVSCDDSNSSGNVSTKTATFQVEPGETVKCTFTNTKRGTIIVEKQTDPDGDPENFSFSGDAVGSISDGQQITVSNVQPGTYTSAETVPNGWDLTSISCSDSNSSGNVSTKTAIFQVEPGETVKCTFTNTKRGTIIVEKQTDPDGDPQGFSFSGDTVGSISDGQQITASNLVPGTYTSTETVPSGWNLISIVCDDTNSSGNVSTKTATFQLDAGETVKCIFTNTKRGTIIVEKQTLPDGDSQNFTFTGSASGSISDGQQLTVNSLLPGTYTSTEIVPSGWDLTSVSCDDSNSSGNVGTKTATFQLEAGEVVKCIFTNTKRGTIIVEKQTLPDGDSQSFTFTGTASGLISDGQQITVNNVQPGTYTSTETVPSDWDLTSINCDDTNSSGNVNTKTASFQLEPGEIVKCIFTNTKRGTIIVEKQTLPDGDSQSFTFTGTASGSISDGQQIIVNNVQPGAYTSTETVPSGWDLTSINCDDTNSSGNVSAKTATFQVEPGETVKCVFTNTKRGTIIVEKQTLPDGDSQSFTFTGTASGSISDGQQITVNNVQPGTYTSTETVPSGWDLTSISCGDSNSSGNVNTKTASFQLDPGETVICVFTNTKQGTLIVEKQTTPDGDPQNFSFTGDVTGSIADNGQLVIVRAPGAYVSTEIALSGWQLTSIVCDDSNSVGDANNRTATFQVEAGETVKCVFSNAKWGTIIVEKQTLPDGDSQSFTFTGTASGSISDAQQIAVSNLLPGTYSATESVPFGWDLTSIACDDTNSTGNTATATASFQLDPGETVKCVFTNTKRGAIIVEKQTLPDGDSQSFTFTGTANGAISDGQQITVNNLQPGAYSSTETMSFGWDLTSIACDDTNSTGNTAIATVSFQLDPGETVKCVFTNTKRGTIIVEKQTNPDGDTQSFTFTGTAVGSISDGQQITVMNIVPGVYSSTETVPFGWDVTSILCDDTNSTGNIATATASFQLDPGETVKCTFTNTKQGTVEGFVFVDVDSDGQPHENGEPMMAGWTIQIYRVTVNPNSSQMTSQLAATTSYTLVGSTVSDSTGHYRLNRLLPGTYVVCEANRNPVIWQQKFPASPFSPPCAADAGNGYMLTIDVGQTIDNISFGNGICFGQLGNINGVIYMDVDGDGNRDPNEPYLKGITITLTGTDILGNPVNLTTTTDTQGKYIFPNLLPGTYTVCQTPPPGMHQTFPRSGPRCLGGTVQHVISLACSPLFAKFADMPDAMGESEGFTVLGVQTLSSANDIRYQVAGYGIKELQLYLYDLKGKLIYRSEWQANGWVWALQDQSQRRVARGVYLYTLAIRGANGQFVKTKLQKLLVASHTDEASVARVETLSVTNAVHFYLSGLGVKAMRVQIFDLTGKSVYHSGWQPGHWAWDLRQQDHQRLPQGLYTALVSVRGLNGEIVKTVLQKVIVK
jgi:uncharacterized cupredoxin-like copper-binding protein